MLRRTVPFLVFLTALPTFGLPFSARDFSAPSAFSLASLASFWASVSAASPALVGGVFFGRFLGGTFFAFLGDDFAEPGDHRDGDVTGHRLAGTVGDVASR